MIFFLFATGGWVNGEMTQLKGDWTFLMSKHLTSNSLLALNVCNVSLLIPRHKGDRKVLIYLNTLSLVFYNFLKKSTVKITSVKQKNDIKVQ